MLDESPDSKVYLLGRTAEGRYLSGHQPADAVAAATA
jgi:hypothetical protein